MTSVAPRARFGQAQPKSSDSQQGPLATPARQASARQSATPAMAQQFGSSQTRGSYSAYSPSGNYQQYSQPSGYPQGGHMNYAQPMSRPYGPGGGSQQPQPQNAGMYGGVVPREQLFPKPQQAPPAMRREDFRRLTPLEQSEILQQPGVKIDRDGNVRQDLEKVRARYGTRIGKEGQIGTADFVDADRDGIDDRHQRGPGMPGERGSTQPQYMPVGGETGYSPGVPSRNRQPLGADAVYYPSRPYGGGQAVPQQPARPYYGTPEANYPGFPASGPGTAPAAPRMGEVIRQPQPSNTYYGGGSGANGQPFYSPSDFGQRASQPQVFQLPSMDQGPQFYNQRDAFINNINQSLGRQSSFGTPTPQPPQLDFASLWAKAGDMSRNGWSNPLAGLFA